MEVEIYQTDHGDNGGYKNLPEKKPKGGALL